VEIREALEQASQQTPEPAPAPEPAAAPEPSPVVETSAPDAAPSPAPSQGRARDEAGRFTKAAEAAPEKPAGTAPKGDVHGAASAAPPAGQGKAEGAVPPPAPSAEPASPPVKAPQSWTPQAREAFSKAPPEVQAEVAKREKEIARALQEAAPARQYAQQVQESLRPYETIARANGMDAMSWAGQALQTVASLYAGTPQQKAQTIAQAILTSGADLEAINAALQNPQAPTRQAAPSQPRVDPREEVRRILEEERTMSAAREFLANPPEFYDTVKDDVHDILRLDRQRGGNLTPAQAYDRACRFNEDVQSVLAQRKAAEAARTQQQVTARAQVAASSVRSTPAAAPSTAAQPKSIRGALEAADQHLSGRV
jgi:hypothetical protein